MLSRDIPLQQGIKASGKRDSEAVIPSGHRSGTHAHPYLSLSLSLFSVPSVPPPRDRFSGSGSGRNGRRSTTVPAVPGLPPVDAWAQPAPVTRLHLPAQTLRLCFRVPISRLWWLRVSCAPLIAAPASADGSGACDCCGSGDRGSPLCSGGTGCRWQGFHPLRRCRSHKACGEGQSTQAATQGQGGAQAHGHGGGAPHR